MIGLYYTPVRDTRHVLFHFFLKGNSVCCHVHGFNPYLYVQAPIDFKSGNLHDFRVALNQAVLADMKSNKENVVNAVLNVELMNKSNLYQFQV